MRVAHHGSHYCNCSLPVLAHFCRLARCTKVVSCLRYSYVRCQRRPGNKRPSLATGFASDQVDRAGDEALDDG
jgi:hypothetical protein